MKDYKMMSRIKGIAGGVTTWRQVATKINLAINESWIKNKVHALQYKSSWTLWMMTNSSKKTPNLFNKLKSPEP